MALKPSHIISAFLCNAGKILVSKSNPLPGAYQGRWSAIIGLVSDKDVLSQAYQLVLEQTGLERTEIRYITSDHTISFDDQALGVRWIIHPYVFYVLRPETIDMDWTHLDFHWVSPEQLQNMDTIPCLWEAYNACFKAPVATTTG